MLNSSSMVYGAGSTSGTFISNKDQSQQVLDIINKLPTGQNGVFTSEKDVEKLIIDITNNDNFPTFQELIPYELFNHVTGYRFPDFSAYYRWILKPSQENDISYSLKLLLIEHFENLPSYIKIKITEHINFNEEEHNANVALVKQMAINYANKKTVTTNPHEISKNESERKEILEKLDQIGASNSTKNAITDILNNNPKTPSFLFIALILFILYKIFK